MERRLIILQLWRYNFSGTGVMADSENVLCCKMLTLPHLAQDANSAPLDIFCTSVVDRAALTLDEMTYLLSEHVGDDNVEAYVNKLASVWNKVNNLPKVIEGPARISQPGFSQGGFTP
jgi:hypothetical protein